MREFDGIIVLATGESILYVAVVTVCRVRVSHDRLKFIVDRIQFIFVTICNVNNTAYVNQQLLKVKILATCFSYSETPSGQKQNIVIVPVLNVQYQNYVLFLA